MGEPCFIELFVDESGKETTFGEISLYNRDPSKNQRVTFGILYPLFQQQSTMVWDKKYNLHQILAIGRTASRAADDVQANLVEAQDLWNKQKISAEEAEQVPYRLKWCDRRQRRERIEPI